MYKKYQVLLHLIVYSFSVFARISIHAMFSEESLWDIMHYDCAQLQRNLDQLSTTELLQRSYKLDGILADFDRCKAVLGIASSVAVFHIVKQPSSLDYFLQSRSADVTLCAGIVGGYYLYSRNAMIQKAQTELLKEQERRRNNRVDPIIQKNLSVRERNQCRIVQEKREP